MIVSMDPGICELARMFLIQEAQATAHLQVRRPGNLLHRFGYMINLPIGRAASDATMQ